MRTSVYTFLLTIALLLTPCAFLHAGTDDSGLQVFTVDFSKQLGESADVAQEDTLFSPYCYNLFSSGNGICSFPRPKGTGYLFPGASAFGIDGVNLNNLGATVVRIDGNITASVYLHYNSGFSPSPLGTQVPLDNNAYATFNSDLFAFTRGATQSVFLGTKIIDVSNLGPSPVTTEVVLKASGVPFSLPWNSAAIWQNRLFLTYQNYLYYSAAQDFDDFTSSATAGGVTRLYEDNYISKIVSTRYGLYIFTGSGIWLQSGASAKNSWSIEKISNVTQASAFYKDDDTIYFQAFANAEGKKIWRLNGITIEPIVTIPQYLQPTYFNENVYTQMSIINSGRFIVLASFIVGGTSWMYDTQNKSWIRTSEFNGFSDRYFYFKRTSTGYRIYRLPIAEKFYNNYDDDFSLLTPLTPWAYQTSWLTLDGNASNRKEIDRVEFDYQGGTTSVYLYYAYGNGSSSYSNTTLTAPTNTRLSTYVWNAPIGRQQSNRFYLYFLSNGAQTMTTNYILKQARIYYRNIGNYKTNSLR
jgi:hypothetical protein